MTLSAFRYFLDQVSAPVNLRFLRDCLARTSRRGQAQECDERNSEKTARPNGCSLIVNRHWIASHKNELMFIRLAVRRRSPRYFHS